MTPPQRVMPSRVVIDPNVFISALIGKPGSVSLVIAQAVATSKLTLVACPSLLDELSGVVHRDRFRRWFTVAKAERLVDALALIAEMRPNPSTVPPVCADPADDYLFALADEAEVCIIISGDRKVLAVDLPDIAVMSPAAAAGELDELLASRHPWGSGVLPADTADAFQVAAIRGDDKVILAAARFRYALRRRLRRRSLRRIVTPEAAPSLLRYRRQVDKLINQRGMSTLVEYQAPDVAMVKMTDDPGTPFEPQNPSLS